MNKIYFALLFFPFMPLKADEPTVKVTQLESKVAEFDGAKLLLQGDVKLEHSLGSVQASEAIVYPEKDNRANISLITLKGDIHLKLRKGGGLSAPFAELDCKNAKAHFWGEDSQIVSYEEENPAVKIQSRFMTAELSPEKLLSKKQGCSLTAEKDVSILYHNKIQAFSDIALYSKTAGSENDCVEIQLRALAPDYTCRLANGGLSEVNADSILINAFLKTVLFQEPHGSFNAEQKPSSGQDRIYFSSGSMKWDEAGNTLLLQDRVAIEEKSMGKLTAEGPVLLYRSPEGQKKIRLIKCSGPSTFTRQEDNGQQTLSTQGEFSIDLEKMLIEVLKSSEAQISYEDSHGNILADRAALLFTSKEGKFVPVKLNVEGNVQIVNRFAPSQDLQQKYAQYILADRAEYLVDSKELILSGINKNRVLLYDRINQLQLSAPTLKIKRDAVTEKDSVKGIGDVRFVFVDSELEKLKKRFQFDGEAP